MIENFVCGLVLLLFSCKTSAWIESITTTYSAAWYVQLPFVCHYSRDGSIYRNYRPIYRQYPCYRYRYLIGVFRYIGFSIYRIVSL